MMTEKKIRGKKRKLSSLIERINSLTEDFPEEQRYWHMHLPVAQSFIDSPKTPKSIRKKCIQTLIDRTAHLNSIKPDNEKFQRVVTLIDLPKLWNSQIVVFFDEDYFNNFFIRDNPEQTWKPIVDDKEFLKEWNLEIPNGLFLTGYHEIINDEYYYEGQIWAIAELKRLFE